MNPALGAEPSSRPKFHPKIRISYGFWDISTFMVFGKWQFFPALGRKMKFHNVHRCKIRDWKCNHDGIVYTILGELSKGIYYPELARASISRVKFTQYSPFLPSQNNYYLTGTIYLRYYPLFEDCLKWTEVAYFSEWNEGKYTNEVHFKQSENKGWYRKCCPGEKIVYYHASTYPTIQLK